jgi:hypothetical protein
LFSYSTIQVSYEGFRVGSSLKPNDPGDLNVVLCLPRLAVLVSIEADRHGAWFPGLLGPYQAWFPGIGLSRDFRRKKIPGNLMKIPFCFRVFWYRSLFAQLDSRIM